MDNRANRRIDLDVPRPLLQNARGIVMPSLPAKANSLPSEIVIPRIAFALDVGGIEPNDVHKGLAAVCREFFHLRRVALVLRNKSDQLADDVAQPVNDLLARDVTDLAAGKLDVFLAAEYVQERLWFRSGAVPHLVGEDDRIAPGIIVKHGLDGRV